MQKVSGGPSTSLPAPSTSPKLFLSFFFFPSPFLLITKGQRGDLAAKNIPLRYYLQKPQERAHFSKMKAYSLFLRDCAPK